MAQQGSSGSGNLLGDLIAAAVTQALNKHTDRAHQVSRLANANLFFPEQTACPTDPTARSTTRRIEQQPANRAALAQHCRHPNRNNGAASDQPRRGEPSRLQLESRCLRDNPGRCRNNLRRLLPTHKRIQRDTRLHGIPIPNSINSRVYPDSKVR